MLSISCNCEVNEALIVITQMLLSAENTGHRASRLLSEDRSTLDRMEKTLTEMSNCLNKMDMRLTSLTASLDSFNMTGSGSMLNVTNTWREWKLAQEQRMQDISKDVEGLQDDGFIPEAIHEHTTWATTVVFVILIILLIALICIRKKFGFLREQIRNALRNVTP